MAGFATSAGGVLTPVPSLAVIASVVVGAGVSVVTSTNEMNARPNSGIPSPTPNHCSALDFGDDFVGAGL